MIKTQHRIVIGDARQMDEIGDASVHLVATSPPYWQLKDYGVRDQIGFNDDYETYINHLNLVWKGCHRVLHPGCRLCVNIGDQFARSVYYGRYKVIPIRTEIIKFCEHIGFDHMGSIIWQKVSTTHTTGGATIMGSYPYPRNGIVKLDYEYILLFKKRGDPPRASKEVREASRLTHDEWNTYFAGHWRFPGAKQTGHLAVFPEELPRRLIKMFSYVGDAVLDPFLGSGTTSLAAKNLQRSSIGYEVNPDFSPIISEKLDMAQRSMFEEATFEIIHQDRPPMNAKQAKREIEALPYVFTDPVLPDRRVDSRKERYGSKIDGNDVPRERYNAVRKIVSPEVLILKNGVSIRLLGVKARADKANEAVRYLEETTHKKRVFFRLDTPLYDDQSNLLSYLYLENKTFINARLIKQGLVDVDLERDYKRKKHFIRMHEQTAK